MASKKTPKLPYESVTLKDIPDGFFSGMYDPQDVQPAPTAEASKSRGLLAVANDTVIEAANAAAGGLSSAANFIKPGNAVSGWIDKNIIQAGEESQSDVVKASKKKFREGVENADGVMGELGAVGSYIVENPLLAAAQAAGSFVGPGAAVKGAGMVGRAAGLGAKGIERAGRAGGVAAGAAMAGGDAAGTAYDLAIKAGATEEEATAAARQASVIPALVGGAGGAFGAEKLLAGAKGFGGGAAARAAKTGLSEAAQEAVEEGVTQYEGQRAAIPFDPSIDPSKGVAAAAGMGAALGGMTGAGTSLLTGGHGPVTGTALDAAINQPQLTVEQAQAAIDSVSNGTASPDQLALLAQLQADRTGQNNVSPILDMDALQRKGVTPIGLLDEVALSREGLGAPVQVVPERGALSRAANLGAATTQQAAPLTTAAETQEQQQSAQPTEGADMETGEISPEARVGQIQEHLNFLSLMGRNQGWTNEALAQRTALQQELDLLSPAQRMADLQDQAAEAEARAADWAGRQYRPNPTELPEHAAKGGPADIQEANEQRRLKNIQQAQQEAAAARAQVDQVEGEGNAQAQLAAQQDRAARVAQTAPDILNKQGKPFTVKLPAVKAAQAAGAGWEPVKVEGGYVVRQVQPEDSPAPAVPTAPKVPAPAAQAATAKAEEIAREGNAQRQQVAQAGARWDAMQPDAQRAVLAAVPNMAKVIRQNLEGKAWEKMSAGNREKVLGAMNSEAATEQQQKVSEEKPIEGEDLGNGWAAFAPESGTKAVPRAQMPQIKAEHRGAMVNFMNARGIAHQEETVPAASLKPTQAEFSREKVKKALGYEGGDRSILVSQDGHVLDGHHQWMAAREQGKDVKTIRLDSPIEQLLEAAHDFPSSSTSGGATVEALAKPGPPEAVAPVPAEKPATVRKSTAAQAAEVEKGRADYFAPGNIVKSYGGHDRVIAYTAPDADGQWSVKVQAVRKEGDAWVNEPNEGERTHSTPPDARQLKAGPVQAANADAEPAASFRRSSADEAAGADFDVESFLQAMDDGKPVAEARAQAVSAVQKTVDAIRAGWANGPEVTVVYDMADPAIPAAARRADQAQRSGGADGDPEGFYYEGKTYLLASQLHTDKDVARVLMHEALGHHGLRGVFGTGLDSVLGQIVAVRRGDVRKKAVDYGLLDKKKLGNVALDDATADQIWNAMTPEHRLQAAEEVLAEWAQTRPEMGFVRRAVAAIRSWLRQHMPGFKGARVTDDEIIRSYILPARGWVERGAGAGQRNAASFSRSTRPELDTFAAEFMAELSGVDELFHNPIVHAGSAEAALRQIDPTIKFVGDVTAVDERQESGADTKLLFRTANGRDFYVFEKGGDFWLDVSRLDEGGGGNAIYSALMDYAASDNKVFIGDPAGLSDIAMRRRLEAMLSSAIKHGSTDHMQPHARQVQGDEKLGIPALKWKQGDTIGNVQRMIDASLASISAYVPEFRRARYDFATGTFRNSQGLPLSDEDLRGWASEHPRMRAAGAGIRSIKRGILLNTLARAEGGQRPGLLAQVLRQPGQLVGEQAQGIFYSRSASDSVIPDAVIGSTLGSASSHPDYAAAKGGDIEAAVRLAKDLVTPELVAKVKAVIGDSKPLVVPVAAEEAAGRNKIPRASAEVLALRLGLDTAFDIVQANRARRTGMDGLDRLFAPVDFEGAVEPGSYLLLDDTLTQGGTFAALASHIREGGGTVAGVIALTGKQYSAKIQPSVETLASLRQKHGDLENEFRAATGYGFDSLTESEARYLARYEPADRLRDRISEEGRRGRARQDQGDSGSGAVSDGPLFSRSRLADIKGSALSQLDNILSHPGKVSMWDKTVGTMRHLAERNPFFKPVYESAQQNIDDVSMLANDAADQAPRILPRVDSMGDILGKNRKRPVSAADNKAVARPLFEGTLMWGRDINGQATLVEDLTKKYANLSVHNKAAMLLRANRIDAGVLAMWQGLPAQQYEKLIDSRFESKILKAGVVWSDKELQSQFGTTADQISLYREARAAIDRSIDMTARADMMRTLGDGYAAMRDAVLEQPSLDSAGQLLLDMLEQDAKAVPDNRDRLAIQMQQIRKRLEDAKALQDSGYAPLSRFGRYTVDVVDAAGERQYFGMYETMREANTAARNFRLTFPDATVEQGTMSQQAYKLFAGVTPESLELFGNMLGLDSEGNAAQDKAFQEYLKLTKNNHSALKRMIHRKGTAGFSEDVGRVVANFVYSNARQAAAGLNVGALDKAINAIHKDQGELKDLAMGLRSYIQDPQEEGQAVRGMLFAQYLGGSLASAFVNMTQPFQVTLPWLSQYGGMKKAGAQLARALKDMGTKGFQYEADLAKALQSAEDDGVVSPQEIHQLMSQARGAGALRAGDGTAAGNARATAANAWERTKVAWGQPFALAEQFNRRSTFIASYRLAKEQGIQNPSAFARKAVLDTQFVYSKAVKPQWARGTIGGTLFTFKTYSVSYLELMQRMWNQGPAGSPERAAGRRAVGWSIAMLMLMGGAGGLPFAEDIEDLIDAGGQLMGYSMSVKQWRKQLMQDVLGKELAEFIEQGVSGLPGAPIDISGRLGMGNLIPGTGLFLEKRDHSRDMLEIIGPAGDLIQRAATGARKALTGDIAGAALEVSPTAVRNLAKGVDMADSGVYKDSKGRKVIDVTLGEAVAKAVGFQPKSVAETQEATATEQNLIGQNRAMKERLTADMAQAVYDKDAEKQGEIRERMRNWNRRNPESPLTIDMLAVRRRVIKMRQTKAERVAAAAPKSIRASVRQSLAEAQGPTTAP